MARLRIGEVLIDAGLLTKAQLDEALAAQQIYGGRLGTILVEHGLAREEELAHALALQLKVREVSAQELLEIPAHIVGLLSAAQAERYQVLPFRIDEDGIGVFLAMTDPGNLDRVDEIRFALGRRVEMFLCPEIVMSRALEAHYGIPRRPRFIRLHGSSKETSQRDVRPVVASGAPSSSTSGAAGSGVLAQMAAASTPQALIDTMLDTLATFSDQVLFLAARPDGLAGWSGRGLAIPPSAIAALTLRIEESELMRQAFATRQALRAGIGADAGLHAALADRLRLDSREGVMVLPLIVSDCPYGAYVLARPKAGRNNDPTLLSELMRRLGWRLQAIQLMECVTAPLAGCP